VFSQSAKGSRAMHEQPTWGWHEIIGSTRKCRGKDQSEVRQKPHQYVGCDEVT